MQNQNNDPNPVASHALRRKLGSRFGLRWVTGRELAVVMQGEKFLRYQGGPGFFFVVPGLQRVLTVLTIGPDYFHTPLMDLSTNDGLYIGIELFFEYFFDPRKATSNLPIEQARLIRRAPNQDDRRAILTTVAQRVMLSITSGFRAEQICRGQVWDEIEARLFPELNKRLAWFGMAVDPHTSVIQKIHAPEVLMKRFEIAAQRSVNIDNLSAYAPFHITQALRSEAIEAIKDLSGASSYINLHELTSSEGQEGSLGLPDGKIVESHAKDPAAVPAEQPPQAPASGGGGAQTDETETRRRRRRL